MKGFASEALILGGVFLYEKSNAASTVMISLGVASATLRFLLNFNRHQQVDKILEAGQKIVAALLDASNSAKSTAEKIQWENFITKDNQRAN